jgi:hypothetical protein
MNQRPWIITATFPGHPPKAIARTSYKADAEAHIRFLQRYMSQGTFVVSYEEMDERPGEGNSSPVLS